MAGSGKGLMASVEKSAFNTMGDFVQHRAEMFRDSLYDLNREHYEGYMWVACMDWKTCVVCGNLDGKIFPALPGEPDGPPKIPDETHPNCRCVLTPVLKGMKDDYSTVNYKDWFERQPESRQIDILGPSKYVLYKQGMPVERFIKDGRIATLEELGALSARKKDILFSQSSGEPIEYIIIANEDNDYRVKLTKDILNKFGLPTDFNESSRDTINYMLELHEHVVKDFPKLNDTLRLITYTDRFDIVDGAGFNIRFNYIAYNKLIFNNKSNLLAYITQKPGWFASTDIRSVIAHEYGHAIERLLVSLSGKQNIVRNLVVKTLKENGITSWNRVMSDISIHAGDDNSYNALIAELVSDCLSSGENARNISKIVYNKLIELYRSLI